MQASAKPAAALESAIAAPAHADSETKYQEQTMNEPCLCGALDCRACRGSDAHDPDAEDDERRDDYAMRAIVDEVFNEVVCGRMTPEEASDQLDAAGVPFDVQRRVLCGATKEIAA